MPQRRGFSPTPMNKPTVGPHGPRPSAPPNLAPGAQPLPPRSMPLQPASPISSPGPALSGGLPPSMPLSPAQPTMPGMPGQPPPGGMPGAPGMGAGSPMSPMGMGAGMGTGTIDPFDVKPFLTARATGSQFGGTMNGDESSSVDDSGPLPHQSQTTAADLHGGEGPMEPEGDNDEDDPTKNPSLLLKMLGMLGH